MEGADWIQEEGAHWIHEEGADWIQEEGVDWIQEEGAGLIQVLNHDSVSFLLIIQNVVSGLGEMDLGYLDMSLTPRDSSGSLQIESQVVQVFYKVKVYKY